MREDSSTQSIVSPSNDITLVQQRAWWIAFFLFKRIFLILSPNFTRVFCMKMKSKSKVSRTHKEWNHPNAHRRLGTTYSLVGTDATCRYAVHRMVMMCGNYNAGEPYSCVHAKCINAVDEAPMLTMPAAVFFSVEVCSWCVPVHGWSFDVYFPYSAQFFVDNSIVVDGMNFPVAWFVDREQVCESVHHWHRFCVTGHVIQCNMRLACGKWCLKECYVSIIRPLRSIM